jgi:hypothetical protein
MDLISRSGENEISAEQLAFPTYSEVIAHKKHSRRGLGKTLSKAVLSL